MTDAPPPPHVAWIARLQLAALALAVAAGVVAAALLQAELWQPQRAVIGPRGYGHQLTYHAVLLALALGPAALAGAGGYLAITRLTGARRIPAPAIGYAGVALWVAGAVIVIVATLHGSDAADGWTFYVPDGVEQPQPPAVRWKMIGDAVVAGAGVVFALHLAVIALRDGARVDSMRRALAAVFVLATATAVGSGLVDAITGSADRPAMIEHATLVTAIGIATIALLERPGAGGRADPRVARHAQHLHSVLALLAVALATVILVVPAMPAIIAVGLVVLAVLGPVGRPAVAPVLLGAAPALAGFVVVHVILVTGELHLADTHVVVARTHLRGVVAGFALLAACFAWAPALFGRAPRVGLTWIATAITAAGTLLHVFASIRLGLRGMPRRYWDYDPSFASHHQLAGVAAAIAIVGLVLLVVAFATGPRTSAAARVTDRTPAG